MYGVPLNQRFPRADRHRVHVAIGQDRALLHIVVLLELINHRGLRCRNRRRIAAVRFSCESPIIGVSVKIVSIYSDPIY